MAYIKEMNFHIVGTPTESEVDHSITNNYVNAALGYSKGKGYYWRISRHGRFTVRDEQYGDHVLCAFSFGDKAPSLYEIIVPCQRASKKREREAIELFESNVITAITHRLGYDIEL